MHRLDAASYLKIQSGPGYKRKNSSKCDNGWACTFRRDRIESRPRHLLGSGSGSAMSTGSGSSTARSWVRCNVFVVRPSHLASPSYGKRFLVVTGSSQSVHGGIDFAVRSSLFAGRWARELSQTPRLRDRIHLKAQEKETTRKGRVRSRGPTVRHGVRLANRAPKDPPNIHQGSTKHPSSIHQGSVMVHVPGVALAHPRCLRCVVPE